jgi:hypothetical protein
MAMRKVFLNFLIVFVAVVPLPLVNGQAPFPVARVGGVEISSEDLDRKAGDRVLKARTEEYSIRASVLTQLIDAAACSTRRATSRSGIRATST